MSRTSPHQVVERPSSRKRGVRIPSPPRWVAELIGESIEASSSQDDSLKIDSVVSKEFDLVRVRVEGARSMSASRLEELTVRSYNAIFERLASPPARQPARFWNFLPAIHEDMGEGRDRYMVFNAGRFAAFECRYGGRDAFDRTIATASAVGHRGRDLYIYCLASDAPSRPLNNPRQIEPYRYSSRFGPLPPCFSRATILERPGDAPLLLVGGTASICGEDSLHSDDLERQTEETFENLAALVRSGRAMLKGGDDHCPNHPLDCYRELRVYHPRGEHAETLRSLIAAAFPRLRRLEMVEAELCRDELLVEIEGIASLS
jgi:chorismate lyase/3-hydroxybenzoate synthase